MQNRELFYRPRLRVLALTPGLAPGGAEQHLSTLIRHAQTVEYARILATAHTATDGAVVDIPGVPVTVVPSAPGRYEADMTEAIKGVSDQYDIILYWGFKAMDLSFTGKPVIHLIHFSMTEDTNSGHQEWAAAYGETNAHFLTCVSRSGITAFSEEARAVTEVTVIHNGADLERTAPIYGRDWQRKQWGLSDDDIACLYVGRLYIGKGPDKLVEAMTFLPDNYKAIIYGWGAMGPELRDLATESPGRVIFPQPRLKGLGDVYAASDMVVIPSNSEAFPLVLIEAWQAGKPVVSSRYETIAELEEMYAGSEPLVWSMPCPPTSEDVADTIMQLDAEDPRVGRACSLAHSEFTAGRMVGRWEEYFYNCFRRWLDVSQCGAVEVVQ